MREKYHLYMDESGTFEGSSKRAKKENCLFLAALVPDSGHEILMEKVQTLQQQFGYSGFIHASEVSTTPQFQPYLKALLDLLEQEDFFLAVQGYQDDIHEGLGQAQQEIFAANRYLSMAQCLFEQLFFLAPEFHGQDLDFALHPNSRVVTVAKHEKKALKQIEALGYHQLSIGSGKMEAALFFTWTSDIVSATIHRLAVEYSLWQERMGQRNFPTVETIVAKKSSNPLVHMVDHLAWLYAQSLRGRHQNLGEQLRARIAFDLSYGPEQVAYRSMMRAALAKDLRGLLLQAQEKGSVLVNSYYQKTIKAQIEKALTDPTLESEQMEAIEQLAGTWLRQSTGNWGFVLKLVTSLIGMLNGLSEEKRLAPRIQRLLFRLYSHQLSIHNHRGEDVDAAEAYDAIEQLALGQLSIEDYRERLAIENRISVTLANIFDFEGAIANLKPHILALEESLKPLRKAAGQPLTDSLLGKLRGSMAQACAFIAPRKKEYYTVAKNFFLEAASSFTKEEDILRHDINLLHLYLEERRMEDAEAMAECIRATPAVQRFFNKTSAQTARSCQFALAVLLKYDLSMPPSQQKVKMKISLDFLQQWFGESVNEHPFELICAYLGRMAMAAGDVEAAEGYFSHALAIPFTNNLREQPTLQTIRAQILVWWALDLVAANQMVLAWEKKGAAVSIMKEIGTTKGLETILDLMVNPPTGWFAPGWDSLIAEECDCLIAQDGCEPFLQCFTFNYH